MKNIRNIAIIAHVDHGKTTLVDSMLKQSGIFRENEKVSERVMDSNDLERERGITILSKNTAIQYKDLKINIVDTPGHADFGGEVERVLKMVDGVLLLVDSFEGPMPQTKFVLKKAIEEKLKPIVVINKIDRPDARPHEVLDEVFQLFLDLDADEEQLNFPVVYAAARDGYAMLEVEDEKKDLQPLFETIIEQIPSPEGDSANPLQVLVTTLDYDNYQGRMCIGKINQGKVKNNETINVIRHDGSMYQSRIAKLYTFMGLRKQEIAEATAGDIICISGLTDIQIGETIACREQPQQLPVITVDEPTLTMTFIVNNSPFAGLEGEYVTSRKIRERLYKEMETNVSLRVEDTDTPEAFQVSGRGELHLSILIENMRREGYEVQVSKPEVIFKRENGQLLEPMENLIIDIPEEYMGPVMENLGTRKAETVNIINHGLGNIRLEYKIPARGLIGFRSQFISETRGTGIMNHTFCGYEPFKGEISTRYHGALIAWENGEATQYGLHAFQDRGIFFIVPGTKVYEGMIVGEYNRESDLEINVCKKKHLTNMRTSGSEEALRLDEPRILTLEQAIEFISDDELVEITPKSIRLRKKILNKEQRKTAAKRNAG